MRIAAAGSRGDGDDGDDAEIWFGRGRAVADTGNYEFAIEMFLQGLVLRPDDIAAHETLRELSLRRKAAGGRDLGVIERAKLELGMRRSGDRIRSLLDAEKRLAYDPDNIRRMLELAHYARVAGLTATTEWMERVIRAAGGEECRL